MLKIKPPNYKFCPLCGAKLGTQVEEEQKRKYCPKCRWKYYPSVSQAACVVIVTNEKVLMVQRAREPYKGTWMFPAGFIHFGEHPEETVQREVLEETGLVVKDLEFLELDQVIDDPRSSGHFVFFYKGKAEGKILNKDPKENKAVEWIDIKNPPRIGWKRHKDIMKKLQKGEI